jgi:hypothetical protein
MYGSNDLVSYMHNIRICEVLIITSVWGSTMLELDSEGQYGWAMKQDARY